MLIFKSLKGRFLKQLLLILIMITNLLSLDINEAVELGLEKKSKFIDVKNRFDNTNKADDKLDIRLLYFEFLEYRQLMAIVDGAIQKMKDIEDKEGFSIVLVNNKKDIEKKFLYTKDILESITNKNIDDINNVESIDFSSLKNDSLETLIDKSLENSQQIQSLENELLKNDIKDIDSSWNLDISGEIIYGHEKVKRKNASDYEGNEVGLGLSIVLSKNDNFKKDSTIEIAKKRSDLEKKKTIIKSEIKNHRKNYITALQKYKISKLDLKKYDIKNLKTSQEIKEAYNAYNNNVKILSNVYKKYARLLHIIEKN